MSSVLNTRMHRQPKCRQYQGPVESHTRGRNIIENNLESANTNVFWLLTLS